MDVLFHSACDFLSSIMEIMPRTKKKCWAAIHFLKLIDCDPQHIMNELVIDQFSNN